MKEIIFVSNNEEKIAEVKKILEGTNVKVIGIKCKINEMQTENVDELVKDKLLKAFEKVGRPVFVDHTCLYIDSLNGLPGGLTQIFWEKLEKENNFFELFGNLENRSLTAKTVIAYCDNEKIHIFEGTIDGEIARCPKGDKKFQWDCAFVPNGYEETFAQMGEKKNGISMRKKAFDKFKCFLEK